MIDENDSKKPDLEQEKITLDRYKAKLEFWKFVLGSVCAAVAIAAIPPSFQLASAVLESVKNDKDRQVQQQERRDAYVKEFLDNAVNQNIELRIRFAQYFAHVSADAYRQDWSKYFDRLQEKRDQTRKKIDEMEVEWLQAVRAAQPKEQDVERLERNLKWAYDEVGQASNLVSRSVVAKSGSGIAKGTLEVWISR